MQIAIYAMQALLAKDFKNIGYSTYSSSHRSAAEYIADQSFILADAMIERENKKEENEKEKL